MNKKVTLLMVLTASTLLASCGGEVPSSSSVESSTPSSSASTALPYSIGEFFEVINTATNFKTTVKDKTNTYGEIVHAKTYFQAATPNSISELVYSGIGTFKDGNNYQFTQENKDSTPVLAPGVCLPLSSYILGMELSKIVSPGDFKVEDGITYLYNATKIKNIQNFLGLKTFTCDKLRYEAGWKNTSFTFTPVKGDKDISISYLVEGINTSGVAVIEDALLNSEVPSKIDVSPITTILNNATTTKNYTATAEGSWINDNGESITKTDDIADLDAILPIFASEEISDGSSLHIANTKGKDSALMTSYVSNNDKKYQVKGTKNATDETKTDYVATLLGDQTTDIYSLAGINSISKSIVENANCTRKIILVDDNKAEVGTGFAFDSVTDKGALIEAMVSILPIYGKKITSALSTGWAQYAEASVYALKDGSLELDIFLGYATGATYNTAITYHNIGTSVVPTDYLKDVTFPA